MSDKLGVDVSIIIVLNNHEAFISSCLQSIVTSCKSINYEIILVDNNSNDNGKAIVKTAFPSVVLIEHIAKYGFAKNNNLAIMESNGKYILLLNPDTVVKECAIDKLVRFMDTQLDAGACGGKLLFPDGSLQLSCRRFPTIKSSLIRRTPIRVLFPYKKRGSEHLMSNWDHMSTIKVDWMLGACLMIRREILYDIGFLDENFQLYCEDIDLCLRIKRKNWNIYYVHDAEIIHYHLAKSDKSFFCYNTYVHFKSMFYFLQKNWQFFKKGGTY